VAAETSYLMLFLLLLVLEAAGSINKDLLIYRQLDLVELDFLIKHHVLYFIDML